MLVLQLPIPGGAPDHLHTSDWWDAFYVCGHLPVENQLYRPWHPAKGHP